MDRRTNYGTDFKDSLRIAVDNDQRRKSPAMSAFLNRLKAINVMRLQKGIMAGVMIIETKRINNLRKQIGHPLNKSIDNGSNHRSLSPDKSMSPDVPSNKASLKVFIHEEAPNSTPSWELRPVKNKKAISHSLLLKLRNKGHRTPVDDLHRMFPNFRIQYLNGNDPTNNLAKQQMMIHIEGTSVADRDPIMKIKEVDIKDRNLSDFSRAVVKKGNPLGPFRSKNLDSDALLPDLPEEPLTGGYNLRKTLKDHARSRTSYNFIDYGNLFGKSDGLEGEDLLKWRMLQYRDFLWKVAFSFEISLTTFQKPRYYIGKGNNSKLLRSLMSKRSWWIREKDEGQANFLWTQLKVQQVYSKQPTSQKAQSQLMSDSLPLSDSLSPSPAMEDPTKNLLNAQQYQTWQRYILKNHRKERKSTLELENRRSINTSLKPVPSRFRMTNHLEFSRLLGNKKALFFTMRQYYSLIGRNYNDYMPLTFHITGGQEDDEYLNFVTAYQEKKKSAGSTIWIVKPGEMSNRGNGITVCDKLSDVKMLVCRKERHDNGKCKTYIVQQYLHQPFLYKNRKFDIRHYIMIASINGIIKGYWYEEGYIRTTSYEYVLTKLDTSVHLTNDAVQKYCKDYGKWEKGNKVSYKDFQTYLDGKYGSGTFNFEQLLETRIKSIAIDSIRAAYACIDPNRRLNNFQIFGMDFMVDEQFNPWLIEINTNPCLQLSSPLLARIIPAMVDNALRICVDPVYPPPITTLPKKLQLQPNRFELVFDQLTDGPIIQEFYQGKPTIEQELGNVGSDDQAYEDQDQEDQF